MAAVRKPARASESVADERSGGPFLGVAQSAKDMLWRERLAPADQINAAAISQKHGLPDLLGRMIAARGITVDQVATFLDPSIRALMPDPDTLRGMDVAAGRL
ncbi:MAG: single-stranded-DNA-specific exonuclease RecJ, partial [Hyphomicrobiaceae bacterium]